MVTKKGYKDLVTRKVADAQRLQFLEEMKLRVWVGRFCVAGPVMYTRARRKETHRKRANICIYCVEKKPIW